MSWDKEWAHQKSTEALRWLAKNYPECAASEALREHEEAAYEAAKAGDREGYLQALRDYMKAGREEALRIRHPVVDEEDTGYVQMTIDGEEAVEHHA